MAIDEDHDGRGRSPGVAGREHGEEPGTRHWQEGYIRRPGLDDRGDVFFAAVEMTRMPMVVTDPNQPDNPIVFSNGAFLDLTGYDEDEVIGRNCRFLQGARTDRETVREVREALERRQAVSVEILNYKRDGTPFWNALFIGPIFDHHGRLIYFFASQLDVTRRRVSEQAFRQAQKMEAIGQLTAGLAHDFNNLLQVISGNLERATDALGTLGPEHASKARSAIENAERAARQGAKLTHQLLAFARKQRLEAKPVNLNLLVVEFSDMLARTLGETVDLRLDLSPRTGACILDPVHFEMALLNVLINARDAMPEGGRVTVSTSPVRLDGDAADHNLGPGDYVALAVADEGEGMASDVLERASEPFFTTKEPGKGTGLGLAMVHGFVQQSRGRLDIDSEPGRGTRVRMLFPAFSGKPERSPEEEGAAAAEDGRTDVDAATILVVDDSDDVRDLAEGHLRAVGYEVIPARSGEEALALARDARRLDLLFTDLVMPGGMNGLQLAEQLRRLRPRLPVLLTTGYTDELVAEGPKAPNMDVLGKPYRRSELTDRVRAALNAPLERMDRPLQPPRHEG